MEWPPVDRAAYVSGLKFRQKRVAVDRKAIQSQAEREEVPGVNPVRIGQRKVDLLEVLERLPIARGDRLSLLPHLFGPRKLVDPNRRSDIGEVVFEARLQNLVIPASSSGVPAPRI